MAETLLTFELENLLNLLSRESDRFKGIDKQLTELKTGLNTLRSFLPDADPKRHPSWKVRDFLIDINEIVFDAEDMIETFLLNEDRRKTSVIKDVARRLSCVIVDRKEVASDMKDISKRISKVIGDMQSFGVQTNVGDYVSPHRRQDRQTEMRRTFPTIYESGPVDLEDSVKKLIGYLMDEDSSQVVAITGMGGIGKTTLARQVFNHDAIKSHFPGLAWVCVSQEFRRKSVWQTILRQLRPEYEIIKMSENELHERLFRVLETQKALIVIDDIWLEEDWDFIKYIFPRSKGYKILLTSRIEGVALHADPTCVTFRPGVRTPEESWNLFKKIAFPMSDTIEDKIDEEMEKLGKEMVQQCEGLTLAVKVLGGLLAEEYTLNMWKRVHENIKSFPFGGTSGDTDISDTDISPICRIFSLSFEELPAYLKHCFLCLAYFREDSAIDVEKLAYYLAAEVVLRNRDGVNIRDVADEYIEELVKRNLVISERDVITSRFQTCHLHNLMREVCLRKAKEENFLDIIDANTNYSTATSLSRRIVVQLDGDLSDMKSRLQCRKIRSLLLLKQMSPNFLFTRLHVMRILDLSEAKFEGGRLPSSIGELIHLRYLSLLGAYVSHLPSSMGNLKMLIYLNLCVASRFSIYMSNFLKELQELRCLSLPLEIQDKTKLELGKLTNLEKLENFSTKCSNVSDLHGMIRLRTLSILLNGKGCSMETLSSSLGEMQHLENLTISDRGADRKIYILDGVGRKQVKPIHVKQHFLSHLTTLSLRHCCLEEDPMPVLEKLPQLKEVTLGENAFCGFRIVCSAGGFPQLQKLKLKKLVQLEEWKVEEGSMPLLQSLAIRFCDKLKELSEGLRFIPMKELTVVISERGFMEKLSKGGEDYYKVQHIPVLKIYGYIRN